MKQSNVVADQIEGLLFSKTLNDEWETQLKDIHSEIYRLEAEIAQRDRVISQGIRHVTKLQEQIESYEQTTAKLYERLDKLED